MTKEMLKSSSVLELVSLKFSDLGEVHIEHDMEWKIFLSKGACKNSSGRCLSDYEPAEIIRTKFG